MIRSQMLNYIPMLHCGIIGFKVNEFTWMDDTGVTLVQSIAAAGDCVAHPGPL